MQHTPSTVSSLRLGLMRFRLDRARGRASLLSCVGRTEQMGLPKGQMLLKQWQALPMNAPRLVVTTIFDNALKASFSIFKVVEVLRMAGRPAIRITKFRHELLAASRIHLGSVPDHHSERGLVHQVSKVIQDVHVVC